MTGLRVWTSKDFEGHWPVGVAAVVVARDEAEARGLLAAVLPVHNSPFTLQEVLMDTPNCTILNDGDY